MEKRKNFFQLLVRDQMSWFNKDIVLGGFRRGVIMNLNKNQCLEGRRSPKDGRLFANICKGVMYIGLLVLQALKLYLIG